MAMEAREGTRLCSVCEEPIGEERLEVLPETSLCVKCARKYPPRVIDAGSLDLSEASPINKNGFAPSD